MKTKIIRQSEMTSDCFMIQIWGIDYCKSCEFLATADCGGKDIREKMEKGLYPKDGLK